MARRLRIAIATAGRFHLLNLATELHALGHEVKFYSFVPRTRALKFGLPAECHVTLLPFVAPIVAWEYRAKRLVPSIREWLLYHALNCAAMLRMQPCDVYTFMSGIYLEAAIEAQRRYGAKLWLHRGSRHVVSQSSILAEIPDAEKPTPFCTRRELAGYKIADRIVIPSRHVEASFKEYPEAYVKLFRDPYGVDLAMFPQRIASRRGRPITFLFVGHWSLRKGCDVLISAMLRTHGVKLLHVGPIIDVKFPGNDSRFVHIDAVPQWELTGIYADADAFVHPSREEGLSVVLAQALASGLPVICTDRTGGEDLAHTPALRDRIKVVSHGDVDALAGSMTEFRDRIEHGNGWPPLHESDRQTLSWAAYGTRYNDELLNSF